MILARLTTFFTLSPQQQTEAAAEAGKTDFTELKRRVDNEAQGICQNFSYLSKDDLIKIAALLCTFVNEDASKYGNEIIGSMQRFCALVYSGSQQHAKSEWQESVEYWNKAEERLVNEAPKNVAEAEKSLDKRLEYLHMKFDRNVPEKTELMLAKEAKHYKWSYFICQLATAICYMMSFLPWQRVFDSSLFILTKEEIEEATSTGATVMFADRTKITQEALNTLLGKLHVAFKTNDKKVKRANLLKGFVNELCICFHAKDAGAKKSRDFLRDLLLNIQAKYIQDAKLAKEWTEITQTWTECQTWASSVKEMLLLMAKNELTWKEYAGKNGRNYEEDLAAQTWSLRMFLLMVAIWILPNEEDQPPVPEGKRDLVEMVAPQQKSGWGKI